MSLTELPETVNIAGMEIPIETDFRASIAFENMIRNPDTASEDAGIGLLDLYFPQYSGRFLSVTTADEPELVHIATHADETIKAVLDFFGGGLPILRGKGKKGKRLYDFAWDEPYIYASFTQAYKIDLRTAKLHWWNFKALFCSLPQDTVFGRILHIRGIELSPTMSNEEKAHYRQLKRIYALPKATSAQEQAEDERLMAVLEGSGDLAELEVIPH